MAPINPDSLYALIATAARSLRRISESDASQPTKPGEWTSKELLGHLVDSAINNHWRIVRAQIQEHRDADGVLRVPGYEQEQWVKVNDYQSRPFSELIELWVAVNHQLVHTLRAYDSLHDQVPIAIAASQPTPISLALDYEDHLRMHLADFPVGDQPALRPLPRQIHADGLLLRMPTEDDMPALIEAVQDPEIPRWTRVPSPYGLAEAQQFVWRELAWDTSGELTRNYLVFERGTLLAMVGLVRVREDDQIGEVGYWCSKEARGRGVVSRSLQALLGEVLQAGYQRVLLRNGFQREGLFRSVAAGGCGTDATRIDVICFSLLPTDPAAVALLQ
jgi:RimJ/RimL family protein N-acetyltransferase